MPKTRKIGNVGIANTNNQSLFNNKIIIPERIIKLIKVKIPANIR